MADFITTEFWRYYNAVCCLGIMTTLVASVVWYRQRGLDYILARGSAALVFAVLAFASVQSLRRHLPSQDYNFYAAVAFTVFWLCLVTPWRWRVSIYK